MKERSGMPYDVVAYEADEAAMLLSIQEEAAFHRLMRHRWLHQSIPDSMKALARICGLTEKTFSRMWDALDPLLRAWIPSDLYIRVQWPGLIDSRIRSAKEVRRQWNEKDKTAIRLKIFARDGNACLRCGSTDRLVIDHVIAIARGGQNVESNFQTLCWDCNTKKGANA